MWARDRRVIENLKKLALQIAGQAAMKFMQNLSMQQELMMRVADIIIQAFAAESCILRAEKSAAAGKDPNGVQECMTHLFIGEAVEICTRAGREALSTFLEGDELRMNLSALKRFTKYDARNNVGMRRGIAERVLEADGYPIKS